MTTSYDPNKTTERAFLEAIKYISYRPRTEHETRTKLLKSNFQSKVVETTITRCYENNLLNDHQFAALWVESRSNSNPKSIFLIKRELMEKGINREISTAAIQSISDEQNIIKATHKKSRSIRHLSKDQFNKKLTNHLLRKGFNIHLIQKVTCEAWTNRNDD